MLNVSVGTANQTITGQNTGVICVQSGVGPSQQKSKDNWTGPRTNPQANKVMDWVQTVEQSPQGRAGDSSSNNRLRRLNEIVTVNLTRYEWKSHGDQACTGKTI